MTKDDRADPPSTSTGGSFIQMVSRRDRDVGSSPFFVSDRVAPRRRRPSDVGRLLLGTALFGLLGWAASNQSPLDLRVLELVRDLPGWLHALATFSFAASGLAAVIVTGRALIGGGIGRGLARDVSVSLALNLTLAAIASLATHGGWPNALPEFVSTGEYPGYPTTRAGFVVSVSLVLGPYVNARVQQLLRWMVVAAVVTPVLLGYATVTSILGAISLGILSVAAVRLAFGSPEGLPSLDRLRQTLARVGIVVSDLRYLEEQPGTVGLASAIAADRQPLDIKLYGVDAASRQRAERVWRAMWYRTAGPSPRAGRVEQAQHEALALLTARDAGVPVPPLVGAGQTPEGDVLVVSVGSGGVPLSEIDRIDDSTLRNVWRDLETLHEKAHITHGNIGPDTVRVMGDGAEFVDFSDASMFPTEQQLATDVISMLATQAIEVGVDRALDAVVDAMPEESLVASLPFAQSAVLQPELRRLLKDAGCAVKDLRDGLAERLEIEPTELASVRRVKVLDVVIAVAAIFAANTLISQISDVGLEALADEVRSASGGWLAVAFLIRIASASVGYIGLRAVVGPALPFSPTFMLNLAKSFVGLVVPSVVGRVSMDIRYLQNLGVSLSVASVQGPVLSFIGFISEIVLLLLSAWSVGQELETDGLFDIDSGGLIALAALLAVAGVGIVLSIPRLRGKIVPAVRDATGSLRTIVSSPKTLGTVFASETLERIVGALALGATMAAFGAHISFPALIFVSVGTGLLAGLAPVPGGIGVAEATMTGLLTSVGVPTSQAVTIAIVHRFLTSYLPPVVGFFSLRWLRSEGYV